MHKLRFDGGLRLFFLDGRDQHLVDPLSIHIYDLKAQIIPFKRFGHGRNASHLCKHETAQGLVGVFFFPGRLSR